MIIVSDADVLRANERGFTVAGLPVSVTLPAPRPAPDVIRQIRRIGRPGVVAVPELSTATRLVRLVVHALGTFVCVLTVSLTLLALAPAAIGFRPLVVASGSMAPALRTSDVVVGRQPPDELGVGAVIDYDAGDANRIHRIVEVTDAGYRTQGDANPTPDPGLVAHEDVDSVGVMVVPFVGAPRLWVEEGEWLQLVVSVLVLGCSTWVASRRWLNRLPDPFREGADRW